MHRATAVSLGVLLRPHDLQLQGRALPEHGVQHCAAETGVRLLGGLRGSVSVSLSTTVYKISSAFNFSVVQRWTTEKLNTADGQSSCYACIRPGCQMVDDVREQGAAEFPQMCACYKVARLGLRVRHSAQQSASLSPANAFVASCRCRILLRTKKAGQGNRRALHPLAADPRNLWLDFEMTNSQTGLLGRPSFSSYSTSLAVRKTASYATCP
eukprot:SAG31_NODE_1306_length_8889_cov_17.337315_8_plen_212_part_00